MINAEFSIPQISLIVAVDVDVKHVKNALKNETADKNKKETNNVNNLTA